MVRKLIKETALAQAVRIFWKNGYNGTSMEMLTQGLGVEKPSIYAAFGNKRSLFLAALTHYRTGLVDSVRRALEAADTPRIGLDRVVRFMMTTIYHPDSFGGCFATNAALELADHDPEVCEHVSTMLKELATVFEQAIAQAQAQGQVTSIASAQVLAGFLVNAVEGVRITEKTQPSPEELDGLVSFVLRALD